MVKKTSEGVGKKIVEALRKQSEIEITPIPEISSAEEDINIVEDSVDNLETIDDAQENESFDSADNISIEENNDNLFDDSLTNQSIDFSSVTSQEPEYKDISIIEEPVMQAFNYQKQMQNSTKEPFNYETFEIPSNIAVLKKLISQLPSGVSKHTGAQIIKQTMEALGISMKGVLQEAQQVQDGLSSSAKECMSNIQEYKKHIMILEKQAQNYHRQYTALNELISLFIQTGV